MGPWCCLSIYVYSTESSSKLGDNTHYVYNQTIMGHGGHAHANTEQITEQILQLMAITQGHEILG
jgi:hypothetical protein